MVRKRGNNMLGAWSFLVGVILALIVGIFNAQLGPSTYNIILAILIVAGILVGLLNVKIKDSSKFLLAALALVIVSFMGDIAISALETIAAFGLGTMLKSLLNALLILFIPTTIIVALRSVFEIARK